MARVSRFKRVPLNVVGGSNETRSRALSISKLVNWYPEATPAGVTDAALMPFPGLTAVAYSDSGVDRGSHVFNDVTYFVRGNYLYRLNSSFTVTQIGLISGANYCSFADNGGVMVICTGGPVYQYDGATLSVVAGIGVSPSVVDYIATFVVFDSDSAQFWFSDSFSVNVQGDNKAVAESSPDALTAPKVFGQVLYLFSEDSIEPWVLASGTPPVERATQAIIERIGCSAPHGITNSIEYVYFIDRSGAPYRLKGFTAEPFAPSGVVYQLQKYDLANYRARNFSFDGQQFILFDFVNDNATWCYSETTNTWFQLGSGLNGDQFQGGSYCYNYGLHLIQDKTLGITYKFDFDSFVNNWGPVVREKTFEFVSGERLSGGRGVYECSRVVFGLEAGVGLLSGQGEEPLLGVQYSIDGKTWSQEHFLELGRSGEFSRKVEWSLMLQFQQLAIRTRLYDPVGFAFFSAAIDVREAGY